MIRRFGVAVIALCFLSSACVPLSQSSPASPPAAPAPNAFKPQPATQPVIPDKMSSRLDDQLKNLSDQIVKELDEGKKAKVAIIEFSDLGGEVSNLGRYVAEELTTRLYRTNRFHVLERELLAKVLEEHKLNLSGLIDESTAVEVGRLLGVDAIGTGTISDLGRFVKVNARMISTESGSIFAVASAEIFKDDRIYSLLNESGQREKPALHRPPAKRLENLTAHATITASTVFGPRFEAINVSDGVIGIRNRGEWAARFQREGAWILLTWTEPKEISKVVLCDRPKLKVHVLDGTLSFSDGTSIKTGQLPNNGIPKEFTFEPKYINWLKFTVDRAKGVHIGLSEIQVFGK